MPLTTLLLDLDGVLRVWPKEYSGLEQAHDLPPGSIGKTAFDRELINQAVTGRISDPQWRLEVSRRLSMAYPSSRVEQAVAAWSKHVGSLHQDVLRLVVEARELCRVGLITNATSRLREDLEALGLAERLDFVVNSSEVGFAKPSPQIFARALAIAGATAPDTMFVDDTAANVSAAAALGMHAHHFTSVPGLRAFLQLCRMSNRPSGQDQERRKSEFFHEPAPCS